MPSANGTQLYGFNWNRCGTLSTACLRFFQAESCYFECDPYQWIYADPTGAPASEFLGVPICSSYCNSWFEACKNDMTCGVEWLYDFVPDNINGETVNYTCATVCALSLCPLDFFFATNLLLCSSQQGTTCKTFGEIYENAQGICDLLWSAPFHYSEDEENCVVWDFALTTNNPNQYVTKVPYSESFCNNTNTLSTLLPPAKTALQPSCLANRELSTPSSQSLTNCPNYNSLSCCGPERDHLITHNDPAAPFLGYNWTACGPVSPQCEQFFIQQACYFECDPYQAAWANPVFDQPATFYGVPICASYCDSWFEACQAELTCTVEWIVGMTAVNNSDGTITGYTCPPQSQCANISSAYNNGRGLCDMMFGSYYHYTEDTNNCVSWDFTGSNPNQNVQKLPYAEGICEISNALDPRSVAIIVLAVFLGLTLFVCLVGFCFIYYREKTSRPVFGDLQMKKLAD